MRILPLIAAALVFPATVPAAADERPPNVILILADDLGWCDLSTNATCFGHASDTYATPAIDTLAREGVAFPNAYSAGANCAPTRASLLSGQSPARHGVYTVQHLDRTGKGPKPPLRGAPNRQDLRADVVTLAEALHGAGYATAHFGKYHVGGHEGGAATLPLSQGFDANFGGGRDGGPGRYHARDDGTFGDRIGPELDGFTTPDGHVTDAITSAAIDFIDAHADRPFFLHVGHYAVHTPIRGQGRADLVETCRARLESTPSAMGHDNVHYAALVAGLDASVGALMEHLRTTHGPDGRPLAENTLVVFTSDNGGLAGPTRNGPLRGQKGEFHEGGIRVPLILWMPERLPAALVRRVPVATVDLYPTILDAAGVPSPAMGQAQDGVSLMPIAMDPRVDLAPRSLVWHFPGYLIGNGRDARPRTQLRHGRWKLVHEYEAGTTRLYDLELDIGESVDVAATYPGVTAMLLRELGEWLEALRPAMPTTRSSGETVAIPRVGASDPDGECDQGAP